MRNYLSKIELSQKIQIENKLITVILRREPDPRTTVLGQCAAGPGTGCPGLAPMRAPQGILRLPFGSFLLFRFPFCDLTFLRSVRARVLIPSPVGIGSSDYIASCQASSLSPVRNFLSLNERAVTPVVRTLPPYEATAWLCPRRVDENLRHTVVKTCTVFNSVEDHGTNTIDQNGDVRAISRLQKRGSGNDSIAAIHCSEMSRAIASRPGSVSRYTGRGSIIPFPRNRASASPCTLDRSKHLSTLLPLSLRTTHCRSFLTRLQP
jgi:hypothetical protein